MRGDEEMILASGCDAYMSKPIAISPFLELIETFMMKVPDISEFAPE
jgi:two-component system, cell cycle response regulator DivK